MGQKVNPYGINLELIKLGLQDGFQKVIHKTSTSRFKN